MNQMCYWSLLIKIYHIVFDKYTVLGLETIFLVQQMGAWINWNYIQLSPPPWLGRSTCHILVESSVILDCHILLESGQNGKDSVDNNQETKVRHRGGNDLSRVSLWTFERLQTCFRIKCTWSMSITAQHQP